MTEVTAWSQPSAVASRDLTQDEVAALDRLRFMLASYVDRTEPRAVSWLWDQLIGTQGNGPAPAGFVEAVAAGLGDLLSVHVPTAHWSVWPGPQGPTLGVISDARPTAPVVPFLDAEDRWTAGSRDWIVDYLSRAAAHLAGATVPQQRPSPDDVTAPPAPAPTVVAPEVPEPLPTRPIPPAPADAVPPVAAPAPVAAATSPWAPELPAADPTADVTDQAPSSVEPVQEDPVATGPAEPIEDFARGTLDHALTVLREAGAFDHEAFVVLVDAGGRRIESCSGQPGRVLFRAREMVRASGAHRAAIVWVDRDPLGLPGPRRAFPAVLVDASDVASTGVRVAQRFVDDVLGTDLLGDPLLVGPVPALL